MSTSSVIKADRVRVEGISAKVLNPAIVLVVLGLLFIVIGALIEEENLRILGYGTLGSALPVLTVGYQSKVGDIRIAPVAGTEGAAAE